ncbi:glycosyltransferase family protein [Niabella drilacis]|uniref:Uncharacterized protein n=1 Tax=Niabella drilacis (strain DSM 25811 / CCM 8410 / CCUG 62505 / LMG 26954 / E90) TaxID=1285928 RepID=A0A1G6PH74_NIADE|nr:hypothetical protein [Niabella drilacis]SDC79590.1 hypothetical protein SAMN04487894_10439 [Niabella drilacis]
MKVLIIELGGSHLENIYTLVHFLKQKNAEVFFLCNEGLKPLVKDTHCYSHCFFAPDDLKGTGNWFAMARRIRSIVKQYQIELIIFGTVESKAVRKMLLLLPKMNITGIIHDAQKLGRSLTFKYVYPFRIKKYIVFGNFILNAVERFPHDRLFPFFPVYFPQPEPIAIRGKLPGERWIVVPGVVSSKRKDFIPLLQQIHEKGLPVNIKLIFLGNLQSTETAIETLVHQINEKEPRIICFKEYVGYDTFHRYIAAADYILPLVKGKEDTVYGKTRVSGAYHLAYGYRKPLLLPAAYKINTDLVTVSLYYENQEDLMAILNNISRNTSLPGSFGEAFNKLPFFDYPSEADKLYHFLLK